MAKTASKNQNAPQNSAQPDEASQDAPKKKLLYLGVSSAYANRLHAGFKPEMWDCTRFDPDPNVKPDIQGYVHELKGIEAGSYHGIWAPHVLHRLYPHIAQAMLQKAYRVLKDEGMLALTVPDAQLAAIFLANNRPDEMLYKSAAGEITAHDVLYGYSKNMEKGLHQFAHRTGFTCESLGNMLREAGFCSISIKGEGAELTAIAHRYDYDNPHRVEKLSIVYPKAGEKGRPKLPAIPEGQQATPAQNVVVNNLKIDNLDQKPLIWQPLGLGMKKR